MSVFVFLKSIVYVFFFLYSAFAFVSSARANNNIIIIPQGKHRRHAVNAYSVNEKIIKCDNDYCSSML